jgi:hypothetical protein
MRERLRNFDSKITFFAFADIITAVSGMLIFITLLLATDLGRPTDSRSQAANAELEQQLQETLAQQADADAKNRGLQNILTTANTAPPPDKLESDISRLRAELAQEKSKHAGLAEQLAASKSTLEERDKLLGITAVQSRIQDNADELTTMAHEDTKIREEIAALEKQMARVQSRTAKLKSREGQLWLIPDRSPSSKEPLVVIVSGSGIRIERFNHPDQTRQFDKAVAQSEFQTIVKNTKLKEQYFVFLIRPSGIGLFKELVPVARINGFDVGFDALEENKEIHFTPPPPIDDEATTTPHSGAASGPPGRAGASAPSASASPAGTRGPRGSVTGAPYGTGTSASEEPGGDIPNTAGTNVAASSTNGITASTNTSASLTNASGSASNTVSSATNAAPATAPPPPPKPKSWWQRFLEWIGIG